MNSARQRPNIVLILPDQLRPDFLGCYGSAAVETPHIDALANEGVRYCNAYSASPLCVPARVALLTGMNAIKNGVLDNAAFLRPDHRATGVSTWPELLAESGYQTASVGKMHFYPWDASFGFQFRSIAEDKVWSGVHDDYAEMLRRRGLHKPLGGELPTLEHPLATVSPLPRELTVDRFVSDEACRFIAERGDAEPFALMVGFPSPHDPYDPVVESLSRVNDAGLAEAITGPEGLDQLRSVKRSRYQQIAGWSVGTVDYGALDREAAAVVRRHYGALVAQLDDEVGRIVAALSDRGLLDSTMVIVAADHGDHLGDHGLGIGKNTFFDSAIRIPLIVRPPGGRPPLTSSDIVELRDVMPTMLSVTCCDAPSYLDSSPLPGIVEGDADVRTVLVGCTNEFLGVLDGRWKLHKYFTGETLLFDTQDDPLEQNDVSRKPSNAELMIELDRILTRELLDSTSAAFFDRRVCTNLIELVGDGEGFGQRGWQRTYPFPLTRRAAARDGYS